MVLVVHDGLLKDGRYGFEDGCVDYGHDDGLGVVVGSGSLVLLRLGRLSSVIAGLEWNCRTEGLVCGVGGFLGVVAF